MRRFIPLILVGLIASGIVAYAASPGIINQYNALCGANTPSYCAQPDSSGNLPVTGTITGTVSSSATATVAAPSYVEATSNPLSQTLVGNLRTTGVGGTFPVTGTFFQTTQPVSVASGQVASGAVASGAYASGSIGSGAIASGAIASGAVASGAVASGAYASGSIAAGAIAAGPTSLVKLEDVGSADADAGVPSMAIQQSTPADTGGTNADYAMLQMSAGRLWVSGGSTTAAAPPATVSAQGAVASGATGGLMAGLKTCDLHAKYDASDNGNITLVTGVSGRKVYVCGYILANGSTATNLSLTEGSDANCATNNAGLTPVYQILANQSVGVMAPFWTGLAVSTNAYFVCVKSSAGNAHQGEIWYTIQ